MVNCQLAIVDSATIREPTRLDGGSTIREPTRLDGGSLSRTTSLGEVLQVAEDILSSTGPIKNIAPSAYRRALASMAVLASFGPVAGTGTAIASDYVHRLERTSSNTSPVDFLAAIDETQATAIRSGRAAVALEDLHEFSDDDWDAEGAKGIGPDLIQAAARLLSKLPDQIPPPDVAPAANGAVCMEWNTSIGSVWFDLEPNRQASVLITLGQFSEERPFAVDAPELETYLLAAVERIYLPQPHSKLRAVLVTA